MRAILSPAEQLTDRLLGFLGYLMKTTQAEVLQLAAESELSFSQLRALYILDGADHELSLNELAERVGLSVAATGRAVDGLVRDALVSRREDELDRRVKRLGVAPAGRDAVAQLGAARRDGLARFVETLSPEQSQALSLALEPVLARPDVQACVVG